MVKYKFPVSDFGVAEGYTRVYVTDFVADIDETDPAQVALAKRYGGELTEPKKTRAPKKRGSK